MDPLALLARSAMFRSVPPAELEALAPALKQRTFAKGTFIFHEGDPGHALYLITAGQVKIARLGRGGQEAVFTVLLPGDLFGELALLDEKAFRTADAQALELTECVTLGRDALIAFLDHHPAVLRRLVSMLGYLERSDNTFVETVFLDIPGRVARKLLDLAASHGEETPGGVRIKMRLSQRTLAGMVAASRENVNRALARFRAHGDIRQEGGFITIEHPAELRKRC